MTLRDGNPFYFLFSRDDQTQIDASKIVVSDIPYDANPLVSNPYPQSLRIGFPATRTPKLRPLGPGLLTFHFDPQPGLKPPDPIDAVIENYDQWPTIGRLRLEVEDDKVVTRIKQITGLPIAPNELWYSSVKISKNFLFESLKKLPVGWSIGGKEKKVDPRTPEGLKLAVSGFLKSRFFARLVAGAQSSTDPQSAIEMPELAPKAPGSFDFYITTGFARQPFDGTEKHYENPNAVTDPWEPAHPHNGIIPARLIYRNLRTHSSGNLIDGDPGNPVPDKILASSATDGVPDYYPIRFTRIWKPEEDCSIHFPSQAVVATHLATEDVTIQRLPAHGIFFLTLTRIQALAGSDFSVSVTNPTERRRHEMRWLKSDGPDDNIWLRTASLLPVTVRPPIADQTLGTIPHVQLRRRMSQEIIYDRKYRPRGFGATCTYFSLRRMVRAFVNNRIAGGRLNWEVYYNRNNDVVGKQTEGTIKLVQEALGADASKVLKGQPNHRVGEGLPSDQQGPLIKVEALKCRAVLEKLFPEFVEPVPPGDPHEIPQQGKVGYDVWQTIYANFQATSTRRFYADKWLAGGGAGALIALGRADDYTVNPGQTTKRRDGETDQSYRSRIVEDMLAGNLEPGAPLQFWQKFKDLDDIRNRGASLPPPDGAGLTGLGHSPIFLTYIGPPSDAAGIVVIDQSGEQNCHRTGEGGEFILPWSFLHTIDAWIATNWNE